MNQIYLSKFVLNTIQGSIFQYILIENGYRYGSSYYSAFSYKFPISFSSGLHSVLYHLPLASPPSTCRSDLCGWFLSHQHLLKVFGQQLEGCELLFMDHFIINAARELTVVYLMQWQQLFPRYLQLSFVMSLLMFILIHGTVQNVALDGSTLPLTSALLCQDDTPP